MGPIVGGVIGTAAVIIILVIVVTAYLIKRKCNVLLCLSLAFIPSSPSHPPSPSPPISLPGEKSNVPTEAVYDEVHDTALGTQQSPGDDVQMGSNICYGHAGGIELETNTCYGQSRQLRTRTQDIQLENNEA